MSAIYKREMKSYFTSPLGYIIIAIIIAINSVLFAKINLAYGQSNMSYASQLFIQMVMVFMVPILTMRIFSEERKLKTDQLLLTSPVNVLDIVMGKFLSSVSIFVMAMLVNLVYWFYCEKYAAVFNFGVAIGNFLAVILVAMTFISMGMFISALTESQFIAAFGSFAIILAILLINIFKTKISNKILLSIIGWFSVYDRFNGFAEGIFDIPALIYYLSVTAVFVFLTVRVIEKRRYA